MFLDLDLRHICFSGSPSLFERKPVSRAFRKRRSGDAATCSSGEEEVVRSILTKADLDAFAYRPDSLLRRLPACVRALEVKSPADCLSLLSDRPESLPAAIDSLLIGVTQFFRDAPVFDGLRTLVIPALRRSTSRPLRVWSIGCSNGAELYSVAVLLAEQGLLQGSVLLGTDCRPDAIEQANRSEYLRAGEIPPPFRRKYFEESPDGALKPIRMLRDRTEWRVADVLRDIECGPWDIVLCRNLAMYLNSPEAAKLWIRLAEVLRPGGFLVTGKAEQRLGPFNLIREQRSVFRKLKGEA
jgi:chemotaxis methyl-accepting protein methylase